MKKNKQNNNPINESDYIDEVALDNEQSVNSDSDNNYNQARNIEYEKELENKINELELKVRQEQELRLRALADYQNLEKRIEKDRQRIMSLSKVQLVENLLPFIDDFERAIEHIQKDESVKDYYQGLSSVAQRLTQNLNQLGIYEIECKIGDVFDSHKHEAVGMVQIENDKLDNTIVQVVTKGYELRLQEESIIIRNVRVIVGKKNSS